MHGSESINNIGVVCVEKAIGGWRRLIQEERRKYYLPSETKEKLTGETRITHGVGYKCYGILVGRHEGSGSLGRPRRRRKRMSEEIFHEGVN